MTATPFRALNEGRSLNSGDTGADGPAGTGAGHAQRRPESELRRHAAGCLGNRPSQSALNEGRSLNSGDTMASLRLRSRSTTAQRRPESELRRHGQELAIDIDALARSTKAGV